MNFLAQVQILSQKIERFAQFARFEAFSPVIVSERQEGGKSGREKVELMCLFIASITFSAPFITLHLI